MTNENNNVHSDFLKGRKNTDHKFYPEKNIYPKGQGYPREYQNDDGTCITGYELFYAVVFLQESRVKELLESDYNYKIDIFPSGL